MRGFFHVAGLALLSALALASARVPAGAETLMETPPVLPPNWSPETSPVKALSSVRAFPPLTAKYLQPIPKPGGVIGRSISFRKVVLGVLPNAGALSAIEPWFHPESLKSLSVTALRYAGYQMVPLREPLFDEVPGEIGSLQIGARIQGVSGRMDTESTKVFGMPTWDNKPTQVLVSEVYRAEGTLIVEWEVFDTAQSRVVFRTMTDGSFNAGGGPTASLSAALHGAFVMATVDLLADRGFYNLVYGDAGQVLEGVSDPIGLDTVLLDSGEPLKSKTATKSLVSIKIGRLEAEGFVLSSDGYVLTSATHLGGLKEVDVKIGRSRKTVKGIVVRLAPSADVALIRVMSDQPLTPLPLRRAPAIIGEKVYILSNGSSTKRISGTLIDIEDGEPGHQVLIADMRHRNKAHGTPLVDVNGNVLGMKIRDFLGEETTRKASRYLSIHDALQALRVHALG